MIQATGRFVLFLNLFTLAFINSTYAGSTKKLILAVDGLSYSAFEEAQNKGLFKTFINSGRHISPYPSMTEPSWTEIMGGRKIFPLQGNIKTIESKYVDLDSATLVDDARNLFTRYANPYNFFRAFDYFFSPFLEPLMYLPNEKLNDTLIQKEITDLESEIYEGFTSDHFIAYISSVDAIAHTQLNRLFPTLVKLDEVINNIQKHYYQQALPLEIIIISDHGNSGAFKEGTPEEFPLTTTNLNEAITATGLELVQERLTQDNQIAIPVMALGSMANVYFKDLSRRYAFAKQALQNPAVELVTYLEVPADGSHKNIVILGKSDTEARLYWKYDSGKLLYAYRVLNGNPLLLPESLLSHDALRWIIDPEAFEATSRLKYPDALFRLVQSAKKQVANPPDLIVNLNDKYCFEGDFSKYVKMVRTHGSLSSAASLGTLASTTREIPAFIRSQDILQILDLEPKVVFQKVENYFHEDPSSALVKLQANLAHTIPTRIDDMSSSMLFLRATKMVSITRDYASQQEILNLIEGSRSIQKDLRDNTLVQELTEFPFASSQWQTWLGSIPTETLPPPSEIPNLLTNEDRLKALIEGLPSTNLPIQSFSKLVLDGKDLPNLADLFRKGLMKAYAFPQIFADLLNIPERSAIKDTRSLEFAATWIKNNRERVAQEPGLLYRDKNLSLGLFHEIFEERKLLHSASPANFPLLYNPTPKDVTVVFIPGIYNELFDREIFSKGLRSLQEQLGLRVIYADVDGRCSTGINAKSIISFLKEDSLQRLSRGYTRPQYLILGYSKGGVDATEAVLLDPEFTREQILGILAIAAPLRGASILQVADIPSLVMKKVSPTRPLPPECVVQSASQSLSPSARESFWSKNIDGLEGLTRFYSVSFVSEVEDSHPWMRLTKQIARFRDVPNDGVVTEESSRFPEALHPIHLGTIEHTDHLAGILASSFPQSPFLEAAMIFLFETHSLNNRALKSNYEAVSQAAPKLFTNYHKRAILQYLETPLRSILEKKTQMSPSQSDRTVHWYDSIEESDQLLKKRLNCVSNQLPSITKTIMSATEGTDYLLKSFNLSCSDTTPSKLQIQFDEPLAWLKFWKSTPATVYTVDAVDELMTLFLSKGMRSGENKLDLESLGITQIPKSNRPPLQLPQSSLNWSDEERISLLNMEKFLRQEQVAVFEKKNREGIQILFDHSSFKDFRREYRFSYESTAPAGIDDEPKKGYVPVREVIDGKEETVARMRAINESTRLTSVSFRFKPSDFPSFHLKLKVTEGVKGANPGKEGGKKDDSAFQVWFTLFNFQKYEANKEQPLDGNDVKLFGYYWGDENPQGLLKPGALLENFYSNFRIPIIGKMLPEAWQIFLDGGSTSPSLKKWTHYTRNLPEDLRIAFPKVSRIEDWQVIGITFQTDAYDMGGSSEAFFKEMSFMK